MLSVLEVLDFVSAEQNGESVQDGGESIDALQYMQWVVGLGWGKWEVDVNPFTVV